LFGVLTSAESVSLKTTNFGSVFHSFHDLQLTDMKNPVSLFVYLMIDCNVWSPAPLRAWGRTLR